MSAKNSEALILNNQELNRVIGGIPKSSLILIEGANDTGKSVFVQHLTWSALTKGMRVTYITTENTVKSLLAQMASLNWNVDSYFMKGHLKIITIHVKGIQWNEEVSKQYLGVLLRYIKHMVNSDVVIIDSLTYIATHAQSHYVLDFLSEMRNLVDIKGIMCIITIHPFAFSDEMFIRIRSICDGHIIFYKKELSGKNVRLLEVAKLRGAYKSVNNVVTFEVDPVFGIKVLPFSQVKV